MHEGIWIFLSIIGVVVLVCRFIFLIDQEDSYTSKKHTSKKQLIINLINHLKWITICFFPFVVLVITPLPDYEQHYDYDVFEKNNTLYSILENNELINVNVYFGVNLSNPEKYVIRKYVSSGRVGFVKWNKRQAYELLNITDSKEKNE